MKGAAVGIGASAELMKGKRQAGTVFQTSWTVGLLLTVASPEQSVAVDVDLLRDAYVRIVPVEVVLDAIIGSLDEGAEIVGDPPAGEEARLLQGKVVIHPKSGGCAARLSGLGIRKSRLQHDRKRRALPIPAAQRVAAELEAAAKRRQLQESGMASRAWLPGLAGIERE